MKTTIDLTTQRETELLHYVWGNPTHQNWFWHCIEHKDFTILLGYLNALEVKYTFSQLAYLNECFEGELKEQTTK